MENLSKRFNALQDQLMNIYESAPDTLESQIEHWQTLRKEAVLLYFARQHGISRVGYQPVPVLAVSEAKAKQAIGMVLRLQSLQKSEYGSEPWSLVDASAETFRSPPENHFKKGPISVEVIYDKDKDNANAYTMWRFVYYQDDDDKWHKSASGVNQTGIYFMQGTFRHYYVLFADDASRYSTTGQWEVKVNKETVFAPVTSSPPPDSPGGQADSNASSQTPATTTDSTTRQSPRKQSQQTNTKGRRYGRRPSSRTRRTTQTRQRRRSRSKSKSKSRSRSRSRHRSRSRSRSRSESPRRRSRYRSRSGSRGRVALRAITTTTTTTTRRAGGGSPTSTSSTTSERSRQLRGGGRGGSRQRARGRRSSSTSPTPSKRSRGESESVRQHGISPSDVGTAVHTVSSRHTGRLGRLLDEALDPPVILVRGEPNTLKCFRNRAKQRYTGLYKSFSTAWSWVAGDGTERLGRSRMLISFISFSQRKDFDETVKYPKGVDRSFGSFDSL